MVSTLVVLAALTVSLEAVSMASADHPPGPAGYWPADGNADDSTSHSNNGSLLGDTSFGTGKVNDAFAFDSQGDGVQIPASASLNITEELTAAAWINPTKKVVISAATARDRFLNTLMGSTCGPTLTLVPYTLTLLTTSAASTHSRPLASSP